MIALFKLSRKLILLLLVSVFVSLVSFSRFVYADGIPDERPTRLKKISKPVQLHKKEEVRAAPKPIQSSKRTELVEEECEWKLRLSGGAPVWFFDEESTLVGVGGYLDTWRTDYPVNFRVGIEGRHMYLGQEAANFAREFSDKTTQITFIRIPFSIEYMVVMSEDTTFYMGGGPDIIHTANDISDTNVGMHLSARVHYAFNQQWGMAIEGGYMWGDVDGEGSDVELDNAFITPTLSYTF